ncbi:MAG: hypothetical protein ABIO06_07435 [Pseudolysinimonas sp.]
MAENLGVDPSPETANLYLEMLQSGSGTSGTLPPLPTDGFFGRTAELSIILAELERPCAIELSGRGGVGKTRLALHAAHTYAQGDRYWAALGDIPAGELVPDVVAEAVGAQNVTSPLKAIVEKLAPLGPALLVLDGCEAVADEMLDLVTDLRETLPQLRILITTRLPLSGNRVRMPVNALEIPGPARGHSPAVLLLADRVAARGGHLSMDLRNKAALDELATRCEGVPLALELAAAQLAGMAVVDLLDELPGVTAGSTGVLEVMLDQAREALDGEERVVFERLSLVDGPVPRALVRGLVRGVVSPARTTRHLGTLSDSGLITVARDGARWRYSLDDELRRLIRQRIVAPRDAYDGLAEALDHIAPKDATASPTSYRDAIDDASDGFRTLFAASARGEADLTRALDLAYRLHRYWTLTRMAEGRYWLRQLLAGAPLGLTTAHARFAAGYLGYWAADPTALPLLRKAATELEVDAPDVAARALIYAAGLADDLDLADDASRDVLRAVELARIVGSEGLMAAATTGVGAVLAERGDPRAVDYCVEALAALGPDTPAEQRQAVLANCSRLAWQVGDLATARRWATEAMPLLDGPPRIAVSQLSSTLAALDLADGAIDAALHHAQRAIAVARELDLDRELPLVLAICARAHLARGEHDEARVTALACLDSADASATPWTSAIALETCAAIIAESDPAAAETLTRSASELRLAGSRPAPVTLRLNTPPPGVALPRDEASALACNLLEHGVHI